MYLLSPRKAPYLRQQTVEDTSHYGHTPTMIGSRTSCSVSKTLAVPLYWLVKEDVHVPVLMKPHNPATRIYKAYAKVPTPALSDPC